MTTKTRRKIDAALKAKIAAGSRAGVADLAQRYEVHPNQIYGEEATAGRRPGPLRRAPGARARMREREIEKLHAKIGQSDSRARFFNAEVRKMSTPDRRGMLDRADMALIRRQCMLLGIARGVYRPPRPATTTTLP